MTILRHYKMTATEGRGSDLRSALEELAIKVRPLPGCEAVRLFADPEDSLTYVFIEDWRSLDDHKAAGRALGKEAFAAVAALLSGPPDGRYLEAHSAI
jgi:quinol monooxygenase YgiN